FITTCPPPSPLFPYTTLFRSPLRRSRGGARTRRRPLLLRCLPGETQARGAGAPHAGPHRARRGHRRASADAGVGGSLRAGHRLPGHRQGRPRQHESAVPRVRRVVRVLPRERRRPSTRLGTTRSPRSDAWPWSTSATSPFRRTRRRAGSITPLSTAVGDCSTWPTPRTTPST